MNLTIIRKDFLICRTRMRTIQMTCNIRFIKNEVPKKFTFETLSETLNEQNYDPVVPQEIKVYKANVRKDKVLTWKTDKRNVSRKRNKSNIIRNKHGPSRGAKDIKHHSTAGHY